MSQLLRRLAGFTDDGGLALAGSSSRGQFRAPNVEIAGKIADNDLAGALELLRRTRERNSAMVEVDETVRERRVLRNAADETFVNEAAEKLIQQYNETGEVPQELIDFYAARGVPANTLVALANGELPMDAASRAARAAELGLEFDTPTTRVDAPGKTEFKGRLRGGLTYTGFNLDRARAAAQDTGQAYPLIGEKVLGLHENDADNLDIRSDQNRRQAEALEASRSEGREEYPPDVVGKWERQGKRLKEKLEEQAMLPYSPPGSPEARMLRDLIETPDTVPGSEEFAGRVAPHYPGYEIPDLSGRSQWRGQDLANYQIRELLNEQGVGGILVDDEGPLSIAYHNPQTLRHASLSLLDPQSRGKGNIYGAIMPVAAAGASSGKKEKKQVPVLTPSEIEMLRKEYPNANPAKFKQLEDAAAAVQMSDGIEADGVYFSPPEDSRPRQIARAQPRSYRENERKERIANMDEAGRQRMEQYYSAVVDAMQQPVISVAAAVDASVARGSSAEAVQQRLAEAYPNGYMSPSDFLKEISVQPFLSQVDTLRSQGLEIPDEIVEAQVEQFQLLAARQAQTAADYIGHRDRHPESEGPARIVMGAVAAHAPKAAYANYGSRDYTENAAIAADGKNPNYTLTPEGAQNHQALRVAELFSASNDNYIPEQGVSQAMRLATPFIHGGKAADRAVAEFVQMGSPAGKFAYAADLYRRAGEGDQQQVFGPEGEPKNYMYDMKNMLGMGQRMMNTSFPLARMYNNTAPVREVSLHAGEAMADRDYGPTTENIRRLRREYRAITPTFPDGIDPAKHQALGEKLDNADSRMEGWVSAYAGPKFADAGNVAIGALNVLRPEGTKFPEFKRTYLSPAADTVLATPGESLSDPVNLAFNAATGGIGGAMSGAAKSGIKGAMKGAVRGLGRAPFRMVDDIVEEGVENAGIGSATMGIGDFFKPSKSNLMMDGSGKGPNDDGYDQELERRTLQARQDQLDAADEYAKLRTNATPRNRPIAEVRW